MLKILIKFMLTLVNKVYVGMYNTKNHKYFMEAKKKPSLKKKSKNTCRPPWSPFSSVDYQSLQ